MKQELKFFKVEKKLPSDSDWIIMKVTDYNPSGFVIGKFYEGFKSEDDIDITEYVEKWADLPDWGLV